MTEQNGSKSFYVGSVRASRALRGGFASTHEALRTAASMEQTVESDGAATLEEAVIRHYAESLFLATLLPKSARRVADLGSGGGFPGFRWRCWRPDVEVTLGIGPAKGRVSTRGFGLRGQHSGQVHSSGVAGGNFDAVVGRAIRPADILATARRIAGGFGILLSRSDAEFWLGV